MKNTEEQINDVLLRVMSLEPEINCNICDISYRLRNKFGKYLVMPLINKDVRDISLMLIHLMIDTYNIGVEDGIKKVKEIKDIEELERMFGEKE